MYILKQRWRQGINAGGTKTVRVPAASEARKIFTDHTFKIGLKCHYTLYKHNKQVTEVSTVHRIFQKIKCRWEGSVNFWGGSCPPKHPRLRHPCLKVIISFSRNIEEMLQMKTENIECNNVCATIIKNDLRILRQSIRHQATVSHYL